MGEEMLHRDGLIALATKAIIGVQICLERKLRMRRKLRKY